VGVCCLSAISYVFVLINRVFPLLQGIYCLSCNCTWVDVLALENSMFSFNIKNKLRREV
jgi:hypothetical protein